VSGVPAPLEAASLDACLAELGQARMLPRAAYLDPDVLAWERASFFGSWMCVGYSADLGQPGDRRAIDTGAGSVLIVRGDDGELRAFANTCRHRGHELLPGDAAGTGGAIVCPYHAWTYRLDGTLRGAPGYRRVDGFDPAQFGLAPIRATDWHGWIFIDPRGDSADFAAHIGSLEATVAPYTPERLRVLARHEYVVAANWKIIIENYQECYHCSVIHPSCAGSARRPAATTSNRTVPGSAARWRCATASRRCRWTDTAAAWPWPGSPSASAEPSCTWSGSRTC
jgi:Rieske 2Fe-2S family protein